MSIDAGAPVITRDRILVNAPVARVWKVQTDVQAWPRWQSNVEQVQAEGPIIPGSVFRWRTSGLDITSTVVDVEPLRRLEWGGPANGITAVHVWTFEPTDDGVLVSTEESWTGEPIEAAVQQMQAALDASLAQWLVNLKARAESDA